MYLPAVRESRFHAAQSWPDIRKKEFNWKISRMILASGQLYLFTYLDLKGSPVRAGALPALVANCPVHRMRTCVCQLLVIEQPEIMVVIEKL